MKNWLKYEVMKKKLRWGIVGLGNFTQIAVIPAIKKVEDCELVGAFSTNHDKLKKVCEKFKIQRTYDSYQNMLKDKDIDVVYISTPNVFHYEQVLSAAKSRKHVFCQKPMGMNALQCQKMVDVCSKYGVALGVGFVMRFHDVQRKAYQMINNGELGDVSFGIFSYHCQFEPKGWRFDYKISGGGPLMDLGVHLIDLACWFFGNEVESVTSTVVPYNGLQIEGDVVVLLEFAGNKKAVIDTSYTRVSHHDYHIYGSKKMAYACGSMGWFPEGELFVGSGTGVKSDRINFRKRNNHYEREIKAYADAVIHGQKHPVNGYDGLRAAVIVDAIYNSAKTGKKITVKNMYKN